MHYVYLLKRFKSQSIYVGFTSDLRRRLAEHKRKYPCELIYYEAFRNEKDARNRELKLKNFGSGLGHLKNRLQKSLQE